MARYCVEKGLLGLLGLLVGCGDGGGNVTASFDSETGMPGATDGVATTDGPDPTTGTPPEVEDEGDFRVPQASGKYVYTASKTTDSVAVIDTATLEIDVVEVGQGPTVVQPIPGQAGEAGAA